MSEKLKDCKTGDLVRIWCIGTLSWDEEVVKIIDNSSSFIKVQYKNGMTAEFVPSTECKVVSF